MARARTTRSRRPAKKDSRQEARTRAEATAEAKAARSIRRAKDDRPATQGREARAKPTGTALSGKDQEVDDLLAEARRDERDAAPDERPRGGGGGGRSPTASRPPQKPGQTDRSRLSGKDKETDEHLEELTGRKRRRRTTTDERSGPAGEIIKEMRDIEQKLGKPDTGEATREEQKKIVKQIETLIEEMKQSGQSSMGRMVMRRVRQPGQQPGQQQGQTDGCDGPGRAADRSRRKPTTQALHRRRQGHLGPPPARDAGRRSRT